MTNIKTFNKNLPFAPNSGLQNEVYCKKLDLDAFFNNVPRSLIATSIQYLNKLLVKVKSRKRYVGVRRFEIVQPHAVASTYIRGFGAKLRMHESQHFLPRAEAHNSKNFGREFVGTRIDDIIDICKYEVELCGVLWGGSIPLCGRFGMIQGSPGSPGVAAAVCIAPEMQNKDVFAYEFRLTASWMKHRFRAVIMRWVDDVRILTQWWFESEDRRKQLKADAVQFCEGVCRVYMKHFKFKDESPEISVGLCWPIGSAGDLCMRPEQKGCFQSGRGAKPKFLVIGNIISQINSMCDKIVGPVESIAVNDLRDKFARSDIQTKDTKRAAERFTSLHPCFKKMLGSLCTEGVMTIEARPTVT